MCSCLRLFEALRFRNVDKGGKRSGESCIVCHYQSTVEIYQVKSKKEFFHYKITTQKFASSNEFRPVQGDFLIRTDILTKHSFRQTMKADNKRVRNPTK